MPTTSLSDEYGDPAFTDSPVASALIQSNPLLLKLTLGPGKEHPKALIFEKHSHIRPATITACPLSIKCAAQTRTGCLDPTPLPYARPC